MCRKLTMDMGRDASMRSVKTYMDLHLNKEVFS